MQHGTLGDWQGYLRGLASIGYHPVKFWPLRNAMAPEPTKSDRAFLDRIRQVIDFAHDELGMRF